MIDGLRTLADITPAAGRCGAALDEDVGDVHVADIVGRMVEKLELCAASMPPMSSSMPM